MSSEQDVNHQRNSAMRINLGHIAPLLAAGAAAVAIAAAPTAMAAAAPAAGCHMMGGSPVCPDTHSTLTSASDNSQLNASPGGVSDSPQYLDDEGGYLGGYRGGFGGGHGGGFGGGHGGGFGGGHGGGGGFGGGHGGGGGFGGGGR
jgi:hypothetical protein